MAIEKTMEWYKAFMRCFAHIYYKISNRTIRKIMDIKPLKIIGAFKIKPDKFEDERGIFGRTFAIENLKLLI